MQANQVARVATGPVLNAVGKPVSPVRDASVIERPWTFVFDPVEYGMLPILMILAAETFESRARGCGWLRRREAAKWRDNVDFAKHLFGVVTQKACPLDDDVPTPVSFADVEVMALCYFLHEVAECSHACDGREVARIGGWISRDRRSCHEIRASDYGVRFRSAARGASATAV